MSAPTTAVRPGLARANDSRQRNAPTWLVVAAFAAVYVIWGSTYLGIRIAIDSIPPLLMSGGRFLIAGLVLYPAMRLFGAARPTAIEWRHAIMIGALLLLVGNGGVSWAEQTVPTNMVALLIAATPLWINLVDWLRPQGRRPRALVLVGLALGFAGVGFIVWSKNPLGQSIVDPAGAGVLLLASVCWAVGSVWSRHVPRSDSALLTVAMQMIAGGLLLLMAGAGLGETQSFNWRAITTASAYAFLFLTVFGSLIGFTAYVWLLQVSTPQRVSTYAYVNPLIAVFLGWVVLDEALPQGALIAGALIIAAVVAITSVKSRH